MSGVDLKSGFWQCAISEKSRNFFVFSNGQNKYYRFCRVPMGWSGACAYFAFIVCGVYNEADFIKFQQDNKDSEWGREFAKLRYARALSIYLDDLHLHSKSDEDHFMLVKYILVQSRKFDLRLNASKCEILTPNVELLGYKISPSRRVMALSEPRAKLIQV